MREHLARLAKSRFKITTLLHIMSLNSLSWDAADARSLHRMKCHWKTPGRKSIKDSNQLWMQCLSLFSFLFPMNNPQAKLDINFTLSFFYLSCACTAFISLHRKALYVPFQWKGLKLNPVQGPKQAAVELHRELDPPFLLRKFRIKEIKFLPRIQTNPSLDKNLPHACSVRQTRKDCHKKPWEETLATEKWLWSAGWLPQRKWQRQIWQAEEMCLNKSKIRNRKWGWN